MNCLITGFEPFGNDEINPSHDAVLALPDEIHGIRLIKAILPVDRQTAGDQLRALISRHQPEVVLCVGQAGGRTGLTIERIAINVDDYPIPDNGGNQPVDEPIDPNGPDAYLLTLPNKAIVSAWRKAGFPASLSNTAGTFLCNHVAYVAASYRAQHAPGMKTGFIHIPYSTIQSTRHPEAFAMTPEALKEALRIAVTCLNTASDLPNPSEGTLC